MERRTFLLHLGTGGVAGLGTCVMTDYPVPTPQAYTCERESTVTNVVQQFAAPDTVGPDHWSAGESDPLGHLELYASAASARSSLPLDALAAERREAVETFIADTYFDNAMVLYVASVGPTPVHDTIRMCGLRIEGRTIRGRAVVPPRDAGGEEGARTHPSALVRVVFSGPRPERARLTVVSATGRQREFTARPSD